MAEDVARLVEDLDLHHVIGVGHSMGGHTMLDCPVSGTGSQAATGDLVIYASGDTKAIARLKPMFAGYSRKTYDVGTFGNGSKMKYVANLLVAINNVATAEAMVLGMKAGLDPQVIFEMIQNGAGNSRVFELRAPMMVKNDYASDVTMKCSIWQKDMDVIGGYAKKLRVSTPLFSATRPVYHAAIKAGHGEEDTAAVCAVLEAKAKLDSAKELALAEIERAKGVAEANKIIGDSLKGNREYLQYLYIVGLEDGAKNGNKTIYVPTEGGMPVPTLSVEK